MMGMMEMSKTVLISVGGSVNPIIYSLNYQKPKYILFFVSEETQSQVLNIINGLEFKPESFDQIITPSAEKLNECYRTLVEELPKKLNRWRLSYQDLVVDFTGGTKVMSAALVLATIDSGAHYSYVGGVERTKEGVGVVIDSRERILYLANPWDELAVEARKKINTLFNTARYGSALEEIRKLQSKVSENRELYGLLADIVEGYDFWDKFQHRTAKDKLSNGVRSLRIYASASSSSYYSELCQKVESNEQFIRQILDTRSSNRALILDLIANAWRRAELEKKFDDAVARLYRTVELIAEVRLSEIGIKTGNIKPEEIPETLRQEFICKYEDKRNGKIKIGLQASYQLLFALNDELGIKFENQRLELDNLLRNRNQSILAHGREPVKQNVYEGLLEKVFELSEASRADLPMFPILKI